MLEKMPANKTKASILQILEEPEWQFFLYNQRGSSIWDKEPEKQRTLQAFHYSHLISKLIQTALIKLIPLIANLSFSTWIFPTNLKTP